MSRELKFRTWKNGFAYFDLLEDNDIDFFEFCRYADENIEQYTGLKDKNGKEIYEGDIIKMPEWQVEPRYEVVKYDRAGFDPFQAGCFECMPPDGEEVEIIGNIHENPELLGGEV